jgi:hypothetical protein
VYSSPVRRYSIAGALTVHDSIKLTLPELLTPSPLRVASRPSPSKESSCSPSQALHALSPSIIMPSATLSLPVNAKTSPLPRLTDRCLPYSQNNPHESKTGWRAEENECRAVVSSRTGKKPRNCVCVARRRSGAHRLALQGSFRWSLSTSMCYRVWTWCNVRRVDGHSRKVVQWCSPDLGDN